MSIITKEQRNSFINTGISCLGSNCTVCNSAILIKIKKKKRKKNKNIPVKYVSSVMVRYLEFLNYFLYQNGLFSANCVCYLPIFPKLFITGSNGILCVSANKVGIHSQ